ncbi:class II fructose-bisphosphate aldolase [Magnetococcus sp. PR-3]|uniref:class II fructose-bisphosphate aldolase n=1 Tax=Magnetococcus sp. PR-3 TaxID=3120355 RepID=UPI002FCE613D
MREQALLPTLITPLLEKISSAGENRVTVIGVDGPAGVGKSHFCTALESAIQNAGQKVWRYQLDWLLAAREARTRDLAHLQTLEEPFLYEYQHHMHLEKAVQFLQKVAQFNERLAELDAQQSAQLSESIELLELYNRDDQGQLTGTSQCTLHPGLVIVVDGHYTLRSELDAHIDLNLLLLADADTLRQRKVDRVESYRDRTQASDYFDRIDLPSFRHHLARFGCRAHKVINNDDPTNPIIQPLDAISHWLNENPVNLPSTADSALDLSQISCRIFSQSLLQDKATTHAMEQLIEAISEWGRYVGSTLGLRCDQVKAGLRERGLQILQEAEKQLQSDTLRFHIRHTNSLSNVYHRLLPISLGVGIEDREAGVLANVIVEVHSDHLAFQVVAESGYHAFSIYGAYSAPEKALNPVLSWQPVTLVTEVERGAFRLLTPAPFIVPAFLHGYGYDIVTTSLEDRNISPSEAMGRLFQEGGCWIHRFAKFEELRFFYNSVTWAGGMAMRVGNYLIALWHMDEPLLTKFRAFRQGWTPRLSDACRIANDESAYDAMVDQEREAVKAFIANHCADFVYLDGFLHYRYDRYSHEGLQQVADQLERMLNSDQRLLRKRAVNFIQFNFPDLNLPTLDLWPDLLDHAPAHITLEDLSTLSPTILAEVYLWIALREDQSAVLGANIYDIRQDSLDCRAHLDVAAQIGSPVVLQGSLNALGQKETTEDGQEVHGYLKGKEGPLDLVEAALSAARDNLLFNGQEVPLFGIGLDHIDAAHDTPPGRARRFMNLALESQHVTHFVLDGSSLFEVDDRNPESISKAFEKVVDYVMSLVSGDPSTYIYDREVCTGELNYVGGRHRAMIPTPSEMFSYTELYNDKMSSTGLGALNMRPTVFVGNVGTTHHDFDDGDIDLQIAQQWRDHLKKNNFVSAVLHGTSNSHPDILSRATCGCHKINVAGDLLQTLIQGLPESIRAKLTAPEAEVKKELHTIRDQMDRMTYSQRKALLNSLAAHSRRLQDIINSPRLSPMDSEYFRYRFYRFSKAHVKVITDVIRHHAMNEVSTAEVQPLCPERGFQFAASMIEVTFDAHYKALVHTLWDEGINHYHIDVCDGKFTPRRIEALDKVDFLVQNYPEATLHAHLMVENPHLPERDSSGEKDSPIARYIKAGCHAVAIHARAVHGSNGLDMAIAQIRELGARPGLIIETSQPINFQLEQLLERHKIDWLVVMGVPIGFGGQIFDISTLQRITSLHTLAQRRSVPMLIEVDGGLTMETARLCRSVGVQLFSG